MFFRGAFDFTLPIFAVKRAKIWVLDEFGIYGMDASGGNRNLVATLKNGCNFHFSANSIFSTNPGILLRRCRN
jgi:hypothetical protein